MSCSDLSLVYSVEDVVTRDEPMPLYDEDPRSRAETVEDFILLSDDQVTLLLSFIHTLLSFFLRSPDNEQR